MHEGYALRAGAGVTHLENRRLKDIAIGCSDRHDEKYQCPAVFTSDTSVHHCAPLQWWTMVKNGGTGEHWWTLVDNAEHFGIDPVTRPRTADYIALQG